MSWNPRPCPYCTGEQRNMGELTTTDGRRWAAIRCRHCGITYSLRVDVPEDEQAFAEVHSDSDEEEG
jgi:uncharacterized Zn finger protein